MLQFNAGDMLLWWTQKAYLIVRAKHYFIKKKRNDLVANRMLWLVCKNVTLSYKPPYLINLKQAWTA